MIGFKRVSTSRRPGRGPGLLRGYSDGWYFKFETYDQAANAARQAKGLESNITDEHIWHWADSTDIMI